MNLLVRLQIFLFNRKQLRECKDCGHEGIPRREVSVLNLMVFIIIGIAAYMISKTILSIFVPIILAIINGIIAKPRCSKCRSINLK